MSNAKPPLPLWPFVVADAIFLGLAAILLIFGHRPLLWQEAGLVFLCGGLGSWTFITPFLRRNADGQALSQAKLLAEAASQIRNLDQLAAEIRGATNQWVELQSQTTQAASSAKQVADGLAGEAKALTKFMQRSDETEKTHLRLEVEKLRRGEAERLQVIIHVLDHVFALFQAAERSGHPDLIDQLGHFQKACLETVRRIGLVQMGVEAGQAYDPELHKLQDNAAAVENGLVAETVAAGYTYQGQMLRRPVVALKESLK
jgi:molecular chaperone GrpE (heat shock protein)